MIPFPEKKYSVIYADPPWNYAAGGKTRNVERHYRTMKPEDIYSLPVQDNSPYRVRTEIDTDTRGRRKRRRPGQP